jgi:hypothetical protein
MRAIGFDVKTVAAASRKWNNDLRNLAAGIFDNVRVAYLGDQPDPILDQLNVAFGGTLSLSAADTPEALTADLAVHKRKGGLWTVIFHKVGDDSDPVSSRQKSATIACDV